MLELTDLQLIDQICNGDQKSFEILIGRYSDKAFSLALRLTRNQQDAEEVLQDVFVTVYRKIAGFERKSSFSSWLYRVTVNASLMKLRKSKHDPIVLVEEILPHVSNATIDRNAEVSATDHIAIRNQIAEVLEQAIGKLPEEYRPVFVLRDVDGLTSKEVGKMLNLSIPAVKSRLHRSRLMLRRKLRSFFKEFEGHAESAKAVGNV